MANQVTENRTLPLPSDQLGNPLFTAVVGIQRDPGTSLKELVFRFIAINRRIHPQRREMIHCLCVLGEGCYFWGRRAYAESTEAVIAKFMTPEDLADPLMLLEAAPDYGESPFGALVARLYGHLTNIVLADPTDVPHHYGVGQNYQPCLLGTEFIPGVD
jgi:hypothetical protein